MYVRSQDVPLERRTISPSELQLLIGKSDPLILEVGANIGQATEAFLLEMPNSRIFCFEPEPRAIRKFKNRISHPNVSLFECAVGNQNGLVTFHQSSGDGNETNWDQSGSILKPKLHSKTWPSIKFESEIQVPIVRLDDWALDKNLGIVDLIWADVQGAESDLILGGGTVIGNTRFLYTEYGAIEWYEGQPSLDEICESLFSIGLVLYRKWEMEALFVNKNINDLREIKLRRNALCLCGSRLRYKHCHGAMSAIGP
jgi:2-O-methyltransferase